MHLYLLPVRWQQQYPMADSLPAPGLVSALATARAGAATLLLLVAPKQVLPQAPIGKTQAQKLTQLLHTRSDPFSTPGPRVLAMHVQKSGKLD